jgi:hypothetical protein
MAQNVPPQGLAPGQGVEHFLEQFELIVTPIANVPFDYVADNFVEIACAMGACAIISAIISAVGSIF